MQAGDNLQIEIFYCRDGLLRSDRSPHIASVPDAVSTFPAPVDCAQSVLPVTSRYVDSFDVVAEFAP